MHLHTYVHTCILCWLRKHALPASPCTDHLLQCDPACTNKADRSNQRSHYSRPNEIMNQSHATSVVWFEASSCDPVIPWTTASKKTAIFKVCIYVHILDWVTLSGSYHNQMQGLTEQNGWRGWGGVHYSCGHTTLYRCHKNNGDGTNRVHGVDTSHHLWTCVDWQERDAGN